MAPADATERYDRSCLRPCSELDDVDEEGLCAGPITTKRRLHFRARMIMMPLSNWIVMLLISGSGTRCRGGAVPSSSPSSSSSSSERECEGSAAVMVPVATRGL